MKVVLLSSLCSREKYDYIFNNRKAPMLDSNQKFLLSLVNGFLENEVEEIYCISSIPVSYSSYDKRILHNESERCDSVVYNYCGGINFPIIRNYTVEYNVKRIVKDYINKNIDDEVYVICDILRTEVSSIVYWLKRKRIPTFAVVTDIPSVAENMTGNRGLKRLLLSAYGKRANRIMKSFDAYILLSELMNDFCNNDRKKPFMIMECIVDESMFDDVTPKQISNNKVILYAGKFYKECGVLEFAKTAKHLKGICDVYMYGGHGDCMDELLEEAKRTDNLFVKGIVPLKEILAIESGCAVLANPRSPQELFTRYSFPSKTAEYMLSGVPTIMYELPSLPEEYKEYLFFFENNNPLDMANTIMKLLRQEKDSIETASKAKEFIKEKKNCKYQTKRIIDFMRNVNNG